VKGRDTREVGAKRRKGQRKAGRKGGGMKERRGEREALKGGGVKGRHDTEVG
jgi:hypothetical protein